MKFIYVFLSFLLIAGLARGQIRIGGSDLLEPHFGPALSAYAESRNLDIRVDFVGSYPAIEGLKNESLDLAVIAVPDGMTLPEGGVAIHYIGAMVLAAVVPNANPLTQLSLRQLGGIFGEAEAVNITRWGQLGLSGEWSNREIATGTVASVEHALARDLFRHTVIQSRSMRRNLAESDSIETVRHRFQQDTTGIVLLPQVPANPSGLKILAISRGETDIAHVPSPEAVANNDYPLRLPLYLVFKEDRGEELKELLRYIASDEAVEALEETGLLPLPATQRQRLYFEFESL